MLSRFSHVQLCYPYWLFGPWYFSGKNTGVGCPFLLQGILLSQGSNLRLLHLLHWQAGSLPLMPPGQLPWTYSQVMQKSQEADRHKTVHRGSYNGWLQNQECIWNVQVQEPLRTSS